MKIKNQILSLLLLALTLNAHADLTTPSQHEITEAQKQQNRIESQQQDYLSAPNVRSERIDTSKITQGIDGSAQIDIEHTDLTLGAIFDHSTISYGLEFSRILKLGYYKSPETNIWRFVWGFRYSNEDLKRDRSVSGIRHANGR
ncbi:MAG: hypothetical protein KUL82_02870 [Bdellovibrio sp.]|nr:hypothetical protein [Bdellovibrio sp.]